MAKTYDDPAIFFKELIRLCRHHDAYSVAEICAYMNVSHEQIQSWTTESSHWRDSFEACFIICETNTEMALLLKRKHP